MDKIHKILKNDLCLGCGLCEALNPECSKMEISKNGFYRPLFFKTLSSIKEQEIIKVCPGIHLDNKKHQSDSIWGNIKLVSNAWASDDFIRKNSSSGGVTSALAIYLLETHKVDAVLHVGVQNDSYLYNKMFVSRSKEDILSRNSSRYAPAAIFNDIISILNENPNEKFAFIGKPCDIAGMKNLISLYPEYSPKILFFLSIFCAGMPSYNATKKALNILRKNEEPQKLRYRGDGWPGYFNATYLDNTSSKMTYNESWGNILGRDLGFRCKICPDGIGILADIASGDSWNTENGYPDFSEADGRNFCFIRSNIGEELFLDAERTGYICTEKLDLNEVKNMQRYQYERRHYVGWRIAAVQIFSRNILYFKGLGLYRVSLKVNYRKAIKEFLGTCKRLFKLKKNG